jgi:hypothetical protein
MLERAARQNLSIRHELEHTQFMDPLGCDGLFVSKAARNTSATGRIKLDCGLCLFRRTPSIGCRCVGECPRVDERTKEHWLLLDAIFAE